MKPDLIGFVFENFGITPVNLHLQFEFSEFDDREIRVSFRSKLFPVIGMFIFNQTIFQQK